MDTNQKLLPPHIPKSKVRKYGNGFNIMHQTAIDYYIKWFTTSPYDREPDEQTVGDIAKKLNLNRKTLYDWNRTPYFLEQVNRYIKKDNGWKINNVKNMLYCKAMLGDVAAMKLYKEWIAEINEKLDVNNNMNGTIKVDVFNLSDYLRAKKEIK